MTDCSATSSLDNLWQSSVPVIIPGHPDNNSASRANNKMNTSFPVTESILSSKALVKNILPDFEIGDVIMCQFFSRGFNHTYIVKTAERNIYYARIYRIPWRNLDDIRCELDVLNYLAQRGCAAARPYPRRNGDYYYAIEAPEGTRFMVLFAEAPGSELSYADDPQAVAYQYGQAAARLHDALDGFTSRYPRFSIDLDHLINEPLAYIESFLSYRASDWTYLQTAAAAIHRRISELPVNTLEQGFCHGDLQGYHANIAKDGTMTFYDFDCSGFGYRSYDLAVFLWMAKREKQEKLRWPAFLRGYQDMRPLKALDITAIPLFVAARFIWHMGVHMQNAPTWGRDFINDAYFDRQLSYLHAMEAAYL